MMTETTDHAPGWSDPRLAPLRQAELPSFLLGWPGTDDALVQDAIVLRATEASARQGLPAGVRAPAQASEIARGLVSNRQRPFALARLRLPAAPSPHLFYCSVLDLEDGPVVLFADPAASIQTPTTSPGSVKASKIPDIVSPEPEPAAETTPLRFTFEADAANRLRGLSPALLRALGPDAEHWQGATFQELEDGGWIVSGEEAIRALESGTSFAGVRVTTPGPIVMDLELGGVPLFDVTRRRVATRGFGILRTWPKTQTSSWINSFRPGEGRAPSDPSNVVPFNDTLSPRDSETFRDIGRTLHAAMTRDADTKNLADIPPPAETDTDIPSTAAPATATTEPPVGSLPGPRTRELLDALPFATLLEQGGEALHLNRTFLDWSGWTDLDAFRAAGDMAALIARDDAGHADITTARHEDLHLDEQVVETAFIAPTARLFLLHRPVVPAAAVESPAQGPLALRETALNAIPWPVLLLNRDCGIHAANTASATLFGFDTADLLGQPFTMAVPPDMRGEIIGWIDSIARADDLQGTQTRRLVLRTRAGETVSVLAGLARVAAHESLLCLVLAPSAALDIPAQDETDAPTARPAKEANDASSALHHAARRLTQSLGPAFTTLLDAPHTAGEDRDTLPSPVTEALRTVRQCLSDLAALAEPLPETAHETCDPTSIVDAAITYLAPSARRRRIILRTDLAPVPRVRTLPSHLARLVRVMLEEALEATPAHAAVIISLGCDEDTPEAPVRLEIADAGAPLDEVDLAHARAPLSTASDTDRFTRAGRPLRYARMAAEAEAIGAHLSVRRGQNRGMHIILDLPR